jgi:hypothetical protein
MTTRYEFGYGYGDIYRRRMRAQDDMHERFERERRRFPDEDRARLRYESEYYGFRGAGRRGSYETEFRVQPRRRAMPPTGGGRRYYGRGLEPRRWGSR